MPRVGMRMIKSSIAVFICFLIYYIRGEGIVFYSVITAVLCMKPYVSNSVESAINRVIGTFIGGIFGLVLLLFQRSFIPNVNDLVYYAALSACVIPLIYITVVLGKTDISYITCVVFFSVTVSHAVDANIITFVLNRMLDTIIGILVSLGVNTFRLPRRKNEKTLFISELEDTLLDDNGEISSHNSVKLNRLIEEGALISIITRKTSVNVKNAMKDIKLNLPVITMNGAAIYDVLTDKYIECIYMDYDISRKTIKYLEDKGFNLLIHTIVNDTLYIYYTELGNKYEKEYYDFMRGMPLNSHILGIVPDNINIMDIMIINDENSIKQLYKDIKSTSIYSMVKIKIYKYKNDEDAYCMEIYGKKVSRSKAIRKLKNICKADKVTAFGSSNENVKVFLDADYSYYTGNEYCILKENASAVVENASCEEVINAIHKDFHMKSI